MKSTILKELSTLFFASRVGKSIIAIQIVGQIETDKVLFVDCELGGQRYE